MAFNREKFLDAAQKLIEKQKYDQAVIELRRVTDADPNDARTLHKIGELQLKQGLFAEAIDTFETVGKLYANGGFAHKAVAVYKQVREIINTHLPQAAVRYGHIAPKLADLYRELGLNSEALALLEETGAVSQRHGREPDALEAFQKVAELDAQNPLAHLRVAEALSRARNIDGAVNAFQTAARLLLEANRRDDAIQVLERLLQHKQDPMQARLCAELYLHRNRAPQDGMQALAKLQICYQQNPQDVEVLSLIARGFVSVGQMEKAQEIQREVQRLSQAR